MIIEGLRATAPVILLFARSVECERNNFFRIEAPIRRGLLCVIKYFAFQHWRHEPKPFATIRNGLAVAARECDTSKSLTSLANKRMVRTMT